MAVISPPLGSTDIEPQSLATSPESLRYILTLELTPEVFEFLSQLAKETGQSLEDVIRSALAMYGSAFDARDKGK
jgi:hypothetical protein